MVTRIVNLPLVAAAIASCMAVDVHADTPGETDSEVSRSFELAYEDEWVAERNGTKITLFDVQGRLQDIPPGDRAAVLSSPERVARIINDMLLNYGMAERGLERGLLDDPEIQAEIFYRVMYTLARREQAALLVDEQLDDYSARAREYFLANPGEFQELEELTFTHVLFRSPAELRSNALSLASSLLEALDEPSDLDSVELKQFTEDGVSVSRDTQYDITPERLERRFAAGLERMQPGDVAVVESAFGAHVVRLDAREQGGSREFEEVREQLEERARQRHHDQILRHSVEAFYASPLNLADGAVERIIQSQVNADD